MLEDFISSINNREIAIGIWIAVIIIFSLISAKTRPSLYQVFKAALDIKIILLVLLFAGNIALVVWGLSYIQIWKQDQLFPTFMWLSFTGLSLVFRVMTIKENDNYFTSILWDSLKIMFLFEFVVVAYTFSLIAELIMQPLLAAIGAMIVIASYEEKHRQAKIFLEWIVIIFVVVSLWFSLSIILDKPEAFFTSSTARNLVLPTLLAIGSIPFAYFTFCYSKIENTNIQMSMQTFENEDLKHYAKYRLFLKFSYRPWLLKRAVRQLQILPVNNRTDIDKIIRDILKYNRQRKDPQPVEPSVGWSPFVAVELLAEHGLITKDYHETQGGEWWADSDPVEINDHILPSTVSFYISGIETTVKRLKISGHFVDSSDTQTALIRFGEISDDLLKKAFRLFNIDGFELKIEKVDFSSELHGAKVEWKYERWLSDRGYGITFEISRR